MRVVATGLLLLMAALYLVAIGLLMASRIPTYSGKTIGIPVRRDYVVPMILFVVLYIGLLLSFFWETLTVSTLLYFASIPLAIRSYRRTAARHADGTAA